jgi:hypothetical protein
LRVAAGGAVAVDEHRVIDDAEGWGNQFSQALETSLELEQPQASETMKMVVMGLAAKFVARRLARDFDRD